MTKLYFNDDSYYLEPLSSLNMSPAYPGWLNDRNINQFLECRFAEHSRKSCEAYIDECAEKGERLFGIFDSNCDAHIGNIKLCGINHIHNRAQVSLFLGDRSYWNRGIASGALNAIVNFSFNELKLMKLEAGCHELNIPSLRLFRSLNFDISGFFPAHSITDDGGYVGCFWFSRVNDGALPEAQKSRFLDDE